MKLCRPLRETALQVDLFKTEIGWVVLAGYRESSCAASSTCRVVRLLPGNDTRKEAEARWKNEIQSGWLSRQGRFHHRYFHHRSGIRFSNWFPDCRARLKEYGTGRQIDFSNIPCHLGTMTIFQQKVLKATRLVPCGKTQSYGEIARRIGHPRAARAVGGTMARNPIPIIIPCHRIVGHNGKLTGFTAPGGIRFKKKLLMLESILEQ